MKILIIGGTRFIGLYVVQSLLEKGHSICLFNRSGPSVFDGKVEWRQGNRNDEKTLRNALKAIRPDAVLDMIPFNGDQAVMLVRASEGQTPRIVSISSMDVYRAYGIILGIEPPGTHIEPVPISETAPLRSTLYPYRGPVPRKADDPARQMDDYDKIPVEDVVMNAKHIDGTVLRLPFVFGPYDAQHRMYEVLKRILDRRPGIILEQRYAQWRISRGYAVNVAEAIALALTREQAAGMIFNVADRPVWSSEEWVRLIAAATGWSGSIVILPPESTPSHLQVTQNMQQHLVGDSSRIRDILGYTDIIDPNEAIRRTIEWESAHPPDLPPETASKMFDYPAENAALAGQESSK